MFLSSGAVVDGADEQPDVIAAYHHGVERAVKATGVEWTFLRIFFPAVNSLSFAMQLGGGDVAEDAHQAGGEPARVLAHHAGRLAVHLVHDRAVVGLGRRSLPPAVTWNRALRVNRIACRLSLLDRYRGAATFGPLRLPEIETKKFRYAWSRSARACCSTTAGTSQSQARSGVCFACVMTRRDNSPSQMYGNP